MIPTLQILNAIKGRLEEVQWTPPGGSPESAFGEVRLFDSTELVEAFAQLILSKSRVALVIYTGGRWSPMGAMGSVGVRRIADVTVVCSDRVLGNKTEALFGSQSNPGAIALMELAAVALNARLISDPPCDSRPTGDDMLSLKDARTTQPGRFAALLELEITGGLIPVPDQDTAAA